MKKKYPLLFQLFAGYLHDADLAGLTDKEAVIEFKNDCLAADTNELDQVKIELADFLVDLPNTLEMIKIDANRQIDSEKEARVWLQSIQNWLNN